MFGATLLSLLLAAGALAAVGSLTQKAGTAACTSENGTGGSCVDGKALVAAWTVTVSPDGENAYVASLNADAIAVFDRDPATGTLTQKAGTAGCISETGTGGACADGKALIGPSLVRVSPDGASVYVASFDSDAVAIFDRDPATGTLTQKAGTAGCISETGTGGACADGKALDFINWVTISPDGSTVYTAALMSRAVSIFDRNPGTGALTQKAGTAGCISEDGTGGACTDGKALSGALSVEVSPDGANAYVSAQTMTDGVAIFDRSVTTGALTQKPGTAGCISETGTAGACTDGKALVTSTSVAVSPDGRNVYVSAVNSDAVSVFDRSPVGGGLTQKPGILGCISETGTGGACTDGTGLDGPVGVATAPDGTNVYVASGLSDAVDILDRSTSTGALVQLPGTAGCISETGTGGACADGVGLDAARFVTVAPDGGNVYVAASGSQAVSAFDRDTPPETTIESGPSGVIADSTPTFAFSSSEAGSTFECSIDGTPFGAPCSGPGSTHTTIGLAEGAHEFAVRAVDPAANPDASPASRAFTVDTVAPETAVTKAPRKKLKTRKKADYASVSFSSEAGANFDCRLDAGGFEPCSSPFSVKARSKRGKGRKHTISIQATDAAGNLETSPASVAFRLIRKR